MRRITIISALFLCSFAFSQISMRREENNAPITNNQVIGFTSATYPASAMKYILKNIGSTSTNVKATCVSLVNSDGTDAEFCWAGQCLSSVSQGAIYHRNALVLAPGAENASGDHLAYTGTVTGPYPKDYKMKFYQIDAGGNEIGNSITVTYRFDPNLSVDEVGQLQAAGIIVKNTTVSNQLDLDVLKKSKMNIYDLTGKLILNKNLDYGIHSIDVSTFTSGIYILKFSDENGNNSTKRIIKN